MNKEKRLLLVSGLVLLLAGLWAGLLRLGWAWPALQPLLPAAHGPLMVSGFLGTVIALERAAAQRQRWPYALPLLSGAGGVLLLLGVPGGVLLLTLASAGLTLLFVTFLRQHWARHTAVMTVGALAWLGGNGVWLVGRPLHLVTPWWMAFLVLTIAGERLELSRVQRLTVTVQRLFVGAAAVTVVGVLLTLWRYDAGVRIYGVGLLLLALWLLRYDIARRTARQSGLTRYIGVCLYSGYVWLGVGGALALAYGGIPAGLPYDAMLHAVFLGFVFAMIFGHAPIIFPALLGRPLTYAPRFYAHLLALHLSLALRIAGDIFVWPLARQWGGLLNVLVLLLFLANTAVSLRGKVFSHPYSVFSNND